MNQDTKFRLIIKHPKWNRWICSPWLTYLLRSRGIKPRSWKCRLGLIRCRFRQRRTVGLIMAQKFRIYRRRFRGSGINKLPLISRSRIVRVCRDRLPPWNTISGKRSRGSTPMMPLSLNSVRKFKQKGKNWKCQLSSTGTRERNWHTRYRD